MNELDRLNTYYTYGVDSKNRKIFLFDDIEEGSISTIIKGLYLLDSLNDKPIEMFIGSFGGSVYEMFALYDVCQTLTAPIHTVAIGKCMSAAPLLVACGEPGHRYATENTWFMIHRGTADVDAQRAEAIARQLEHDKKLDTRWYELMGKHSKKPASWWRTQCNKPVDIFFSAEQAQEYGLVDILWNQRDGD